MKAKSTTESSAAFNPAEAMSAAINGLMGSMSGLNLPMQQLAQIQADYLKSATDVWNQSLHRLQGDDAAKQRLRDFLGVRPALIVFSDIRALPEAHAAEVFSAYNAMFRRVRGLLDGPETAGLGRDDLNARAHLLLSAAHWQRAWLPRHAAEDHPRLAQRHAQLPLNGLAAPGSAWPGEDMLAPLGLDLVAAAAPPSAAPVAGDPVAPKAKRAPRKKKTDEAQI